MTIRDYIKNCDNVLANVLNEQEKIVYRNENKIIQLNTSQFENGIGSDDKPLKNSNQLFKGIYTLSTQLTNPKKIAGSLYDFNDTGAFLSGMQIDLDSSLTKVNIFSTGTGASDKKIFFDGYRNLFGLNTTNSQKLNYDIIYPELMQFIKKYL